MDWNAILDVLQWVLYFVLGGLAIYMNVSGKAKGLKQALTDFVTNIVIYINEAEDEHDKIGAEKKSEVVAKLYDMLPKTAQKIISKDLIDEVVENVFQEVKAYAVKQLDKAVETATDVVENVNDKIEEKETKATKTTKAKTTRKKTTAKKKTTNEIKTESE